MPARAELTLRRYISGLTLEKWCEYISQSLESRGGLSRVFDKLSLETHKEFGMALNAHDLYSKEALDEFCNAIAEVFNGPKVGLHLGAYSCEQSLGIIGNVLESAKGDPLVLLKERLQVLHKLYCSDGDLVFLQEGENEGWLIFDSWDHNEVSCYSNAGYARRCLELIGIQNVMIGDVEHYTDIHKACRIHLSWDRPKKKS